MKEITVTLKPRIRTVCTKCGEKYTDGRCVCSSCQGKTRDYYPTMDFFRACRSQGHYNLLNLDEIRFSYTFFNAPNGKQYTFVIDEQFACDDPFELLEELKQYIEKECIYYGGQERFDELYSLCQNEDWREEQIRKRLFYERDRLREKLYDLEIQCN